MWFVKQANNKLRVLQVMKIGQTLENKNDVFSIHKQLDYTLLEKI